MSMNHQEISCDEMADADPKSCMDIDGCVAEDSQSEDNDSYVLNCKFHLVGFDASKMRRLADMVRTGSASQFTSLNELLTHIAVGTPSDLRLTVLSLDSSVFRGRSFCFSSNFRDDHRDEIIGWIREGGGKLVETNADYTVEAHGVHRSQFIGVTNVSPQWIKCCFQDGRLLDVSSNILFSPLQCKIPLPGFGRLRFFVSHQVEERSRDLMRNLCFALGGRLPGELTKKVNYLVCELPEGPDYEAAHALGIHTVTIDWILESINQNQLEIQVRSESQFGQMYGSN